MQETVDTVSAAWLSIKDHIAQHIVPALENLINAFLTFSEQVRRQYLYARLAKFLPVSAALWIAQKLPIKLLPSFETSYTYLCNLDQCNYENDL